MKIKDALNLKWKLIEKSEVFGRDTSRIKFTKSLVSDYEVEWNYENEDDKFVVYPVFNCNELPTIKKGYWISLNDDRYWKLSDNLKQARCYIAEYLENK